MGTTSKPCEGADVASAAQAAAERIRLRMSRTGHDIIEIGRDLITTKEGLGHGNFLPWIEAEFGMSQQTASRFMTVAENIDPKLLIVSDLSPTVLYALASPSTPDSIRARRLSWLKGAGRAQSV